MSQIDHQALRRRLRAEFPNLELNDWYVQYRELKAAHPDTVLLYRFGDFYETFDDDAKLIAELLDVTLTYKEFATRRDDKSRQRCPMAGMPYHAIERYVGPLVSAGYRVAVAEQTSETASSKADTRPKSVFAAGIEQAGRRRGLVDREVVRVITPGTVIDTGLLPAAQNNYLTALIAEGGRIGLAYADLSTGEFACAEFSGDRAAALAQGELARLQAVEVLVPDDSALRLPGLEPASAGLTHDLEFMTKDERELLLPGERVARRVERENTARWAHGKVTSWPSWRWELRTARDTLLHQLQVRSLDGFGVADKPLATRAAGAAIQYIHETQNGAASQITSLHAYTIGGYMFLDPQTRRNLELLEGTGGRAKGSLVSVLDHTRTPMGGRLLRRWLSQPLLDVERLTARQDGVAHFVDDALARADVRDQLKQIGDMERAVNRVLQGITVATPRDMVRLREALRALPALAEALGGWMPPGENREQRTKNKEQSAENREPGAENQEPGTENQEPPDFENREWGEQAPGDGEAIAPEDWEWEPELKTQNSKFKTQNSDREPSLREAREARRRPAPRYDDDDDLFGEGDWDGEPEPPTTSRRNGAAGDPRPTNLSLPFDDEPPLRTSHDLGRPPAPASGRPGATGDQSPAFRVQQAGLKAQNQGMSQGEGAKLKTQNHGLSRVEGSKLKTQNSAFDTCADILEFLERALDDDPPALLGASNYLRAEEGGEAPRRTIRPGFDADMETVVAASRDAKRWIDKLEARERANTGIKNLRVDYNKVFGYYIEIPKSFSDRVPANYIRKQTVATAERFFTAELKEYETTVVAAQERLVELEQRAFARICAFAAAEGARLLATAHTLAEVDVYAGLAEAAVRGRYVRPSLHDDTRLRIVAGRHPVVERALDEPFIPNDATLDTEENQLLVVTGPNMAGKSTTLRQVALIVLMAQIGSFVPADAAEIGLADRIFTRIGAQDDIATGQSTFMVEMTETAALLVQSTRRSLIILDEVGRGTSTYDGMAIARAVVEYIHNEPRLGCRTLFATHYHELTELENILPRVKNYHMAAVEQDGRVVFLHELRRGGADRSYGIHVAELAGIPRPVIRRASELLAELERSGREQGQAPTARRSPSAPDAQDAQAPGPQPPDRAGLFDQAPSPLIEMLRRLNVNELSPIEALTKLYELQRLAKQGGD